VDGLMLLIGISRFICRMENKVGFEYINTLMGITCEPFIRITVELFPRRGLFYIQDFFSENFTPE